MTIPDITELPPGHFLKALCELESTRDVFRNMESKIHTACVMIDQKKIGCAVFTLTVSANEIGTADFRLRIRSDK